MAAPMISGTDCAQPLDAASSSRVIAKAVGERTRVRCFRLGSAFEETWSGTIAEHRTEDSLIVALDEATTGMVSGETMLRFEFDLAGSRYEFEAVCEAGSMSNGPSTVRMSRPRVLLRVERRRSSRRRLREAARVTLCIEANERSCQIEGTLLNLSEEGMACRVPESVAGPVSVDDTVRVMIRLPRTTSDVGLLARVVNITPAADTKQSIIGLEFLGSEPCDTVREALRGPIVEISNRGEN